IAAEARFRQARASVRFARAGYFPTATGGASVMRSRQSATLGPRPVARGPLTDYTLPLDLSWELDVWGRVRRSVEANAASAQASDLRVQRAQLEHAIALLVNKPPSEFSLRLASLMATPPTVPVGVPSALLERRPDIAAAERRVAAANAQIGVAEVAYFPTIT